MTLQSPQRRSSDRKALNLHQGEKPSLREPWTLWEKFIGVTLTLIAIPILGLFLYMVFSELLIRWQLH